MIASGIGPSPSTSQIMRTLVILSHLMSSGKELPFDNVPRPCYYAPSDAEFLERQEPKNAHQCQRIDDQDAHLATRPACSWRWLSYWPPS